MPLTPEEQQEFAELHQKYGQANVPGTGVQSGLSPEEQQEFAQLHEKYGNQEAPDKYPAQNIIQKGLDLIPGMKQRREDIAQYRHDNPQTQPPQPADMMDDPAVKVASLFGPESIVGLVKSIPKIGSSLTEFFKAAADRSEVMNAVKNPAELGPYVSGKIKEAGEAFDSSQIAPRMADQYKGASGQFISVDPSKFADIHPEIDQMMSRYPVDPATGKASMPMEDALDLRAELNSKSRFKQGGVYSTADQVRVAQSKAADAGNQLRSAISETDPQLAQSSEALRQNYNLKNAAIGSGDKRPVSTVLSNPATDKQSVLAQFDNAAGTDLQGLGDNITLAKNRLATNSPDKLKNLLSLGMPKEAFNLATQNAGRAYDAAGSAISNLPKSSNQAKLYYLLKGLPKVLPTGGNQ